MPVSVLGAEATENVGQRRNLRIARTDSNTYDGLADFFSPL